MASGVSKLLCRLMVQPPQEGGNGVFAPLSDNTPIHDRGRHDNCGHVKMNVIRSPFDPWSDPHDPFDDKDHEQGYKKAA